MGERPLVVLLGDSVLMEGVATSLGDQRVLNVERVDTDVADLAEHLRSLRPDLIVVDLDAQGSQSIISLLTEQPNTLLLGLDLTCSRAIVLSSHQHATRTMRDLWQVVQAEVGQRAHTTKGGEPATQH